MPKTIKANGAVVAATDSADRKGTFTTLRKADGSFVSTMRRDVYESALADARATLNKKAAPTR